MDDCKCDKAKLKFLEQELLTHRLAIQSCHEILDHMNAPRRPTVTERLHLYYKGQREEPLKELVTSEKEVQ